ncbi:uncharacterized protein BCR38DRAFT_406623 [Pseudomassariella vexata]|uniref:Uncharacterized protein n=1 Tax=Pseudomassariella vexata TaxID=1141098 RepID=A0A1Y2EAX8_9PEZI|nr:uncharacterized protein BCR38DRAFT_406623 [Pseudomassariella vexata]ORY68719.1 hypothetical protein BCR38DRAFT_406623 [Pseudomassariella vexata]
MLFLVGLPIAATIDAGLKGEVCTHMSTKLLGERRRSNQGIRRLYIYLHHSLTAALDVGVLGPGLWSRYSTFISLRAYRGASGTSNRADNRTRVCDAYASAMQR